MKFQKGDKAIVGKSVNREDFLKHVLEEGQEVEIFENYTKWKGEEAYYLKNKTGRIMTEILLAEELELVSNNTILK